MNLDALDRALLSMNPCSYCGEPSERKMCDRCLQVDIRLAGFLQSPTARAVTRTLLEQYKDV